MTRASEVNAAITALLGLDYQQFSQIAMIAQGQFARLLNTDTAQRTEIFRKLFRTQPYQKLQDRLQQESRRMDEELRQGQFARLLNTDTAQRTEIFRKLFRTQPYQKLQDRLQQESRRMDEELRLKNQEIGRILAPVTCPETDPEYEAITQLSDLTAPHAAFRPDRSGHSSGSAGRSRPASDCAAGTALRPPHPAGNSAERGTTDTGCRPAGP